METIRYYREVKASERLPKSNGLYFVKLKSNIGFDIMSYILTYDIETSPIEDYYNDEEVKDTWLNTVDIWLEPIEITEEEIVDVLLIHYHVSTPEEMAKAILSKLKNG